MNDVFILGAGFSKAISNEMPIVKDGELSQEVLKLYKFKDAIPAEILRMIEENFENALDFLASDKPWLSESENLRHRAIYLDFTQVIRYVFSSKSKDPCVWGFNRPPPWLEELIAYWHNNRCAVITLNYDTLIECVAGQIYSPKRPAIPTGESLKNLRASPDYELCQLAEQKPGVLDDLAAECAKHLEIENAELEKQSERLGEEIKQLSGQASSQIF